MTLREIAAGIAIALALISAGDQLLRYVTRRQLRKKGHRQ